LPAPHVPSFTLADMRMLFPAAFTIFVLGGIESLLSAVVADGMTGRRHRANCELVAQGFANIASAIMGGIPATGAIARTATNIRAGAATPIAGIVQSAAIVAMMALFAPFASYIPLAALGAVLAIVCWNMAEMRVFGTILRSTHGDRAILVTTFLLTAFVDLSIAIAAGVVLSALLFARSITATVRAGRLLPVVPDDVDEWSAPNRDAIVREALPPGVEVFRLNGAFFFAVAAEFEDLLSRSGGLPKALILRMAGVPLMDATGAAALKRFIKASASKGTAIVLCELAPAPAAVLQSLGVVVPNVATFAEAVSCARRLLPGP